LLKVCNLPGRLLHSFRRSLKAPLVDVATAPMPMMEAVMDKGSMGKIGSLGR